MLQNHQVTPNLQYFDLQYTTVQIKTQIIYYLVKIEVMFYLWPYSILGFRVSHSGPCVSVFQRTNKRN